MSRAAWLATTLTLVGCSSASSSGGSAETRDGSPADSQAHQEGPDSEASEASAEQDAQAEATDQDTGADADAEAAYDAAEEDAGWHTCYGSPPMRAERAARPAVG